MRRRLPNTIALPGGQIAVCSVAFLPDANTLDCDANRLFDISHAVQSDALPLATMPTGIADAVRAIEEQIKQAEIALLPRRARLFLRRMPDLFAPQNESSRTAIDIACPTACHYPCRP
jgi:hypothetical protein